MITTIYFFLFWIFSFDKTQQVTNRFWQENLTLFFPFSECDLIVKEITRKACWNIAMTSASSMPESICSSSTTIIDDRHYQRNRIFSLCCQSTARQRVLPPVDGFRKRIEIFKGLDFYSISKFLHCWITFSSKETTKFCSKTKFTVEFQRTFTDRDWRTNEKLQERIRYRWSFIVEWSIASTDIEQDSFFSNGSIVSSSRLFSVTFENVRFLFVNRYWRWSKWWNHKFGHEAEIDQCSIKKFLVSNDESFRLFNSKFVTKTSWQSSTSRSVLQ